MKTLPAAQAWIDFAEHDFLAVQTLVTLPKIPSEIVAYHCQQCAEKYLKAVLIQNQAAVPFIHDLLILNKSVSVYLPEITSAESTCERLTPFGTATRYPGGIMAVEPDHLPKVVAWAEEIRAIVSRYFQPTV